LNRRLIDIEADNIHSAMPVVAWPHTALSHPSLKIVVNPNEKLNSLYLGR
jgi:hypothetical protein